MAQKTKLATLLAITENLTNSWKKNVSDYIQSFTKNGGLFKGERSTFAVNPGMQDLPNERREKLVQATVKGNLEWLEKTHTQYIDSLFSIEATNASGTVKASLIVEGKDFGTFSSLELLRLKSLLDSGELTKMYENLPVRDTQEVWRESDDEQYAGTGIYENKVLPFTRYTSERTSVILHDPNVNANSPSYKPVLGEKNITHEIGRGSYQKFSGEISPMERAEILRRKTVLGTAVKAALEIANQAEVVPSEMTAKKIFDYLHRNQ